MMRFAPSSPTTSSWPKSISGGRVIPAEAARLARLRCGQPDNTLQLMREQRGIPWFGVFTLDVTLGLRMLRKYLGLTLIGGIAMSTGFGIVIAVFVYFDVVMWMDSIPLDEGDRVVAFQVWDPENSRRREITIHDFERWRADLQSVENIGAFRTVERDIVYANGEAETVSLAEVSAAGFRVARVSPLIGRTLLEEDEAPGAEAVIVIGYDQWRRRFNGDADVLGRTVRLNDRFHTIVGVMPDDFGFPINHEFWIPFHAESAEVISAPPAGAIFVRLAPGVTIEGAQAELAASGLLSTGTAADRSEPLRPTIVRYANNFIRDSDPDDLANRALNARLVILFVTLLLIPPCANIAMLVYARTVTRKEEIAVRTTLGASRRRIVVQLLIEMLVLSVLAVSVALVAVSLILQFVERLMLGELGRLPFWIDFRLSSDTLIFAAALAVLAAIITGLFPALGATSSYARPGLNMLDSRNRVRLGPVWTLLIVTQIAFACAALPSAVELGWGVLRSHVLGRGFAAEEYLTARLEFDVEVPDELLRSDPQIRSRFNDARRGFLQRLEADPRVLTPVASASAVPGEGRWMRFRLDDDTDTTPPRDGPGLQIDVLRHELDLQARIVRSIRIDDRYLEAFDMEVLTGRAFQPGEYRSDTQAVLVNATFAQVAFAGTNPLGRRISYAPPQPRNANAGSEELWYEIVGVVADRPAHPYLGSIFHPTERSLLSPASIVFRTATTSGSLREDLRNMAAAIDPALAIQEIRTLKELYDEQALGNYLGGFALIAGSLSVLGLAAAGTYALTAFTVNQRRREIAIRLALGARSRKMLRGIFRRALRQVSIGAAVGILLALFVQSYVPARSLGGLDVPGVLPSAFMLLVLIGLAASFGPARRALETEPAESLKDGG